jgi:Mrp family chromosome partitioning ATPase
MTEHTKITVPTHDAGEAGSGSLIERAVAAFDLSKLTPPPVPLTLAPPSARLAARQVAPRALAEPQPQREVQPEPLHLPPLHAAATAAAPPQPVAQQFAQPAAEPAAPAVAPAVASVNFRPVHHPVDRRHLLDQGFIVPEGSVTALLEEFRIVKRKLLLHAKDLARAGQGARAQRVLVCSPHPGEGKTYCAINLALSIAAEKETEVLLVDADFAKPSILSALGLPGGPGMMDALTDPTADVADFVLGTDIPGLWVLPAGDGSTSDSEYLSSSRTPEVLDRLTQGAPNRFVIFDSPPVLAASPAAELAKHVGQAMMIVRADKTGQGALADAVSLLSGCTNIELLLNAVNFSPSGRRFGSYYGYGG